MDLESYFMKMGVHTRVNGKMDKFTDTANCSTNLRNWLMKDIGGTVSSMEKEK